MAASPASTVPLYTLTSYLDSFLRINEVPDESNAVNGLQVENQGQIARIVGAVDASQATIDSVAAQRGDALVLVHHGLFWDGNSPVVGRRYSRLRALMMHNIALYSAHIPLDIHPDLGNNASLARLLDIPVDGWFGEYRGVRIGVWGQCDMPRASLVQRLEQRLNTKVRLIPGGPEISQRVGIITGGAGNMIKDAIAAGLDTFISGEGAHHTYFDAAEGGVNVIYAGHYATETLGVQQLAQHVATRFGIPWSFVDHPTGL
jgi:dinuclear metal center YbgI/SA1388 family protein